MQKHLFKLYNFIKISPKENYNAKYEIYSQIQVAKIKKWDIIRI